MSNPAALWSKIGLQPVVDQSPLQNNPTATPPVNTSISKTNDSNNNGSNTSGPKINDSKTNGSSLPVTQAGNAATRTPAMATSSSGSWADSMEEEEEETRVHGTSVPQCTKCEKLPGIVDYQAKRIKQLETTSAAHISRIAELEAQVSEDSKHISEIEHTTEFRAYYIEELERNLESKHNHCVAQDAELHSQNQRITNLIHHTTEKDHILKQLKRELEKKNHQLAQFEDELAERDTLIDKLELHFGDSTANEERSNAEERGKEESREEEELAEKASGEAVLDEGISDREPGEELGKEEWSATSEQTLPEDMPIPDEEGDRLSTAPEAKTAVILSATSHFPGKDIDGPGPAVSLESLPKWKLTHKAESRPFNLEEYPVLGCPQSHNFTGPVFVTPNMIKSTAPVAPPKQLKMAVDLSKFSKKPQNDPVHMKRPASRLISGGSGNPPVIESTQDVRKMSKEQRLLFGNGGMVQIVMGNDVVATVPKYMFMQCSQKANEHWQKNPTATSMRFAAGSMAKAAINRHVEWMNMHTHCSRVFSISVDAEGTDRERLEIVQVARVLGIHKMYVAHFTRRFCDKIREGVTFDLAALIEELTSTSDDPIFDCLANNSAMLVSKASAEDLVSWKEKLLTLPKLAAKMQKIDAVKRFALGKSTTTPITKRSDSTSKASKPGRRSLNKAEAIPTRTNAVEAGPDADWLATEPAWV